MSSRNFNKRSDVMKRSCSLFLFAFILLASNASRVVALEESFVELCKTGTALQVESAIRELDRDGAVGPELNEAFFGTLWNPNEGVVGVFLRHGAQVDTRIAPDVSDSPTIIHMAALHLGRGESLHEKTIPKLPLSAFMDLLAAGGDINMASGAGTPLHFALIAPRTDPVFLRFLIAEGADVNAQNLDGETPLIQAVGSRQSAETIKILLDAGANFDVLSGPVLEYPDMTVLMWTAAIGEPETTKLLLTRGANANVRNSQGKTAYDIAVEKRNGGVADVLFFRGSVFLQKAAYAFYYLLAVVPFAILALCLYEHHEWLDLRDVSILLLSGSVGFFWILFEVFLFSGIASMVPLIKRIVLLAAADSMLVMNLWYWRYLKGFSVIPYQFKYIMALLCTMGSIAWFWLQEPWLPSLSKNLKIAGSFLILLFCLAISTLVEKKNRLQR